MFTEERVFKEINKIINVICAAIKDEGNISGWHDSKKSCEDFFKHLFNILYQSNLVNVNLIKTNYPAIDIADKDTGICYQITCENEIKKIKSTITTYNNHNIKVDYPKLKIFIFDKKIRGRESIFDGVEVLYKDDLLKSIDLKTLEEKEKILVFLNKYAEVPAIKKARKSLEMESIRKMIEYMANDEIKDSNFYIEKPYPQEKMDLRFGEYQNCIKEQYGELVAQYSNLLEEAKRLFSGDKKMSDNVVLYFRSKSREILFEENNDGKQALQRLIDNIIKEADVEYFDNAVRFYILSELWNCNIFPLKAGEEKQ